MKNLKKRSVNMLCKLGKFGVGKSLTLGMYDFEVPMKLKEGINIGSAKVEELSKEGILLI